MTRINWPVVGVLIVVALFWGGLATLFFISREEPMGKIDFSNPAVLRHHGKVIPIRTQEAYDEALEMVTNLYAEKEHMLTPDDVEDLDHRVLQGMDLETIRINTTKDRDRRFPG